MYLRTARDDLPLSLYPLVMSHDSATGELDERRDGLIAAWAKTQPASLVGQLHCGARALDYRPKLEASGELFAHHGGVTVRVPLAQSVKSIQGWASEHPDQLVLLYLSHFEGDGCEEETAKLLRTLRVKAIRATESASCADQLRDLTYAQARAMSAQPLGGGSVLALFDCTDENYDPSVNCYGKDFVCYESTSAEPFARLSSHLLNVTAAGPDVSSGKLWMAQMHWQNTAATIARGTVHRSSILLDEERSDINEWARQLVEQQQLPYLNIVELDNVCHHGLDMLATIERVYLSGKPSS